MKDKIIETSNEIINALKDETSGLKQELIDKQLKYTSEIEKKDKIINLMAEKINQAYFNEEKFELWFERKVMKVQEKADYGYVVDLIKEYFEKKVEGK